MHITTTLADLNQFFSDCGGRLLEGPRPSAVRTFPARRFTAFGLAFDRLKLKVYNKARAW
jgi:hypothetical protein